MNLIAVVDANWAIGYQGDQLIYIPDDLKRFKALTTGHPVILGRKTLATFPKGLPLPKRRNLILSQNPNFNPQGAEVFPNLEELLAVAPKDGFVIGGGQVYHALLPHCTQAYITKVHKSWTADTWLDNLDADEQWQVVEESPVQTWDGVDYQYVLYRRA